MDKRFNTMRSATIITTIFHCIAAIVFVPFSFICTSQILQSQNKELMSANAAFKEIVFGITIMGVVLAIVSTIPVITGIISLIKSKKIKKIKTFCLDTIVKIVCSIPIGFIGLAAYTLNRIDTKVFGFTLIVMTGFNIMQLFVYLIDRSEGRKRVIKEV